MKYAEAQELRLWVSDEDKIVSMHSVDGYKMLKFPDRELFNEFLLRMIEEYYKIQ